jgi:uncharacterized membrane protein
MTLSDILAKIPRVQFRVIALALFAVLILHILATLAAPRLAPSTAYSRLADLLPVNSMQILPPIAPGAQPLPFMGPDSRYAMCRFDSTKGPVQISAILPGAGWSLSLFSDKGDSLYTSVAQPGRRTEISLVLVTSDEKFAGLTPEASGQSVKEDRSLSLPAKRGIAILRAPDQGLAYKALNEAELKRSLCGVRGKLTAAR